VSSLVGIISYHLLPNIVGFEGIACALAVVRGHAHPSSGGWHVSHVQAQLARSEPGGVSRPDVSDALKVQFESDACTTGLCTSFHANLGAVMCYSMQQPDCFWIAGAMLPLNGGSRRFKVLVLLSLPMVCQNHANVDSAQDQCDHSHVSAA
jgi:hypothetical protein